MWSRKIGRLSEMRFVRLKLYSWMLRANSRAESSVMTEE